MAITSNPEFDEVDSLIEEAHARRDQLDAQMSEIQMMSQGGKMIPPRQRAMYKVWHAERQKLDHAIQGMLNSPYAPAGYLEHYNAKYATPPPEAPPPEQPGIFSRMLEGAGELGGRVMKGIGDTAKFAIQNPGSMLRHIEQGKNELISLPFRALEGAIGRDRLPNFISPIRGMERQQQENVAKDVEAGIDPRGTGPVVGETIGQMAVPVPLPKMLRPEGAAGIFTRESLKNAAKGAAVSSGYHAAERVAHDEPVLDESLGAAAGVGAALNVLLGRLGRVAEGKPSRATPNAPEEMSKPITTPPNAGGTRETIDPSFVRGYDPRQPRGVSPARQLEYSSKTPPSVAESISPKPSAPSGAGPAAPTPGMRPQAKRALEKMLVGEPEKPSLALSQVAKEIEAEKAMRAAQATAPAPGQPRTGVEVLPKAGKPIPPDKIIDTVGRVEKEMDDAAKEIILGKVLKGETKVKDVPLKRAKSPKVEAPVATVEGEVGAIPRVGAESSANVGVASATAAKPSAKPLETPLPASTVGAGDVKTTKPSKAPAKLQEPLKTPTKAPAREMRTEDYIREQGYKIETKEPFPGEKSYNVIDPKTGLTVARGDRENITHGFNARLEGKGIKLTSGVDPTDVGKMLKERLGILPKDVEITNSPHREGPINMTLRSAGLETPQFAMRKNEAGRRAVDAALDAEDLRQTRVNNLFHREQPDGSYKDTKLFDYFGASAKERQAVNDVLVLGDKLDTTFTPEQLTRQGLSPKQIKMYEGVREGLDEVKDWISKIGGHEEFDPKIKGYIPRVWSGDLELFVDGVKHVPLKDGREVGSSFATLRDAAKEIWKIKEANPAAKIEAKFFSDPNFLMHRGISDGRAVARAKANIEAIGKLSPGEIEDAFKISKGYKDFSRHLLARKDAKGYETEDLERVLFSYFHKAAKMVETRRMRDAVNQIMKDHGTKLSSSQVKYLESYVDRVAGKPAWDQMAVDTFVRETPIGKYIDPVKAGGLIKSARDWITYKSLGFGNVSWAMVNLDSLSRHVWPMLQNEAKGMGQTFAAEKYMGKAVKEFFKNTALRQKLAHNNVIDIQMMSEHRPQIGAHLGKAQVTPGQIIMYLGTATEEFTRGVAAIARYRMALDQGLSDGEAMRVASRFVAETVGRYSKAGKPPAFTGITGSTLGMFKTYPVVMMQNMFKAFESKDLGVITRYMLAAVGVGGIVGAVPGSEEIDKLATRFTGKSPLKWAEENVPEGVLTGIMSVAPDPLKMDLSRKAGLPDVFPQDTKDWLGPVLNTYAQAIADIYNGEYEEAAKDLIPTSIRNILNVSEKPGYVMGRYDRPSAKLKEGEWAYEERVKRGLGFQHPDEVRGYRDYGYLYNLNTYRNDRLGDLTRKMYKGDATQAERQEFYRLGGTNRRLREEARRENLTLRQRQERQLPRILRGQAPASE